MKDRLGNILRIGEIVKIVGHQEVPMRNYWIVQGFVEHPLVIEAVLTHFLDHNVMFVPLTDIEKPFN